METSYRLHSPLRPESILTRQEREGIQCVKFRASDFGVLNSGSGSLKIAGFGTSTCRPYGFFLHKFHLDARGFVIANIAFHFVLLACSTSVLGLLAAKHFGYFEGKIHPRIR